MAPPAAVMPPLRYSADASYIFDDPDLTEACGTPVRWEGSGTIEITVFYRIVREVDVWPAFTVTVSAPATGNSFTTPQPAAVTFYYQPGAELNSYVLMTQTGMAFRIGSVMLNTGRYVSEGVVVGYTSEGAPLVEVTGSISQTWPKADEFVTTVCAFLTAE